MIKIIRTTSDHPDFVSLVSYLDAYLAEMDGEDHAFYDQFNKIEKIKHVVLAYDNDIPAGCGAIKEFSPGVMEIKRMYTSPDHRGKGIASQILNELELWTSEIGFIKCILETGKKQEEAIHLYSKSGFKLIPNYGQYIGVENSICFEKVVSSGPGN
ncbi:MAG: GNAT family N-acetyltransferase [Saprospiraceae bacterium]